MTGSSPPDDFLPAERIHNSTLSLDGTRIAYFTERQDTITLCMHDISGDHIQVKADDGWFPTDTIIWGSDDQLFVTRRELGIPSTDIYTVSLDGNLQPIITRTERCLPLDASPDGRWLLFGTQQNRTWDLYLHDIDDCQTDHLADVSGHHYHHQAGFSPDGRYLAYHAPTREDGIEHVRSYLRRIGEPDEQPITSSSVSGNVECLSWHKQSDRLLLAKNDSDGRQYGMFDLRSEDVDWFETDASLTAIYSDTGEFLGTISGEMTQSVVVVAANGSIRQRVLDNGISGVSSADGNPVLATGEVLVTYETPTQPTTVARYDPSAETLEPLIEVSLDGIDQANLVDPEFVAYDSEDGTEIHGLLFDSGERPSPALVDVLGGPTNPVQREFSPRIQYLVSQGYTVLQPNYRGSAGRGEAFKNAIKGDYGGVEVADVAAGGRWLADRGWIDADRVAVFGESWGGYNAYMQLVTNPNLWAACAGLNGPTDLKAMYEEYGQQAVLEESLGGSPAERPEYYYERSPINHVDSVNCPVLILHGEEDPTATDGAQFRDALVAGGKEPGEDFEYRVLEGQDHGPSTNQKRAEVAEYLAMFLNETL